MAEAVKFWHIFTHPIAELISSIGWPLKPWHIDFYAIATLSLFPYLSNVKPSADTVRIRDTKKYIGIAMIIFFIPAPLTVSKNVLIIIICTNYLVLLFLFIIGCIIRYPTSFIITARMLAPPIVIAILAAIAEGMSRPIA